MDHFAALSFLRGLLLILKDSGYSGLVLVLDEREHSTGRRVAGRLVAREHDDETPAQDLDVVEGASLVLRLHEGRDQVVAAILLETLVRCVVDGQILDPGGPRVGASQRHA